MSLAVNIGGVWKDMNKGYVNIGGVWKEIDKIFCNIGGVWKEGYSNGYPPVLWFTRRNISSNKIIYQLIDMESGTIIATATYSTTVSAYSSAYASYDYLAQTKVSPIDGSLLFYSVSVGGFVRVGIDGSINTYLISSLEGSISFDVDFKNSLLYLIDRRYVRKYSLTNMTLMVSSDMFAYIDYPLGTALNASCDTLYVRWGYYNSSGDEDIYRITAFNTSTLGYTHSAANYMDGRYPYTEIDNTFAVTNPSFTVSRKLLNSSNNITVTTIPSGEQVSGDNGRICFNSTNRFIVTYNETTKKISILKYDLALSNVQYTYILDSFSSISTTFTYGLYSNDEYLWVIYRVNTTTIVFKKIRISTWEVVYSLTSSNSTDTMIRADFTKKVWNI